MSIFGFGKSYFETEGKLVVISGGSQGVGAEFAKKLILKGADVIIVARTEEKLKRKVEEISGLKTNKDQIIEYRCGDISKYEDCERIFNSIDRIPDIVVCCAGSSHPDLFLNLKAEFLQQGISTNYNTALFFSHVASCKMASAKDKTTKRHIVFFSSSVAFFSFIGYGAYSPLKAAVKSLADCLRQELLPYNISVECVFPGNFASEGFAEEEKTKPEITKLIEGPSTPISCEKCCDIILANLEKGYQYVTTDTAGYMLSCISLGNSPRCWWWLQVLIAFVLSLIGPIIDWYMNLQITDYFTKNNDKKKD
ncbi:hypothetical protein PACTADRAFT_41145 [Pachysolen tannophilus NRRL Y-2460]|uniref:3-ketodihydrosphingosine reductase TSC10 n=1 Tax=Pachysolen tannophilus NRRL Y-2460 TaxID=669874 RepID=A0A1E4TWW4_PACTA|nr:hypothetical protein PACTADRAFT_41145 [Pachysolen tannophilus NRRL Y-2460]